MPATGMAHRHSAEHHPSLARWRIGSGRWCEHALVAVVDLVGGDDLDLGTDAVGGAEVELALVLASAPVFAVLPACS